MQKLIVVDKELGPDVVVVTDDRLVDVDAEFMKLGVNVGTRAVGPVQGKAISLNPDYDWVLVDDTGDGRSVVLVPLLKAKK